MEKVHLPLFTVTAGGSKQTTKSSRECQKFRLPCDETDGQCAVKESSHCHLFFLVSQEKTKRNCGSLSPTKIF